MSRTNVRAALVLTWNASSVRVKCPYRCPQEIHRHGLDGFTSFELGQRNIRAAHCGPQIDDDGNCVFPQDYRLLFPFEEDPETEGMWWELDREEERWRTVTWQVYDPEYYIRGVETSDEETNAGARDDAEEITRVLGGISIGSDSRKTNRLKKKLDRFCVAGDLEEARQLLLHADDSTTLVNRTLFVEDKPLLLAVTENGHVDIVELLLQHGACLEARDNAGNTTLLRALHYGRLAIAKRLILAGADAEASNDAGDTVARVARRVLESTKHFMRLYRRLLDREDDKIFRLAEDRKAATRSSLEIKAGEAHILQDIIDSCNRAKARRQLADQLRKVGELLGEEQAVYVELQGRLNSDALLARLLGRVADTPRKSKWKTVACLVRGEALPWVFAVSGYLSPSPPNSDGTLHRPTWTHNVFEVAKTIGYELKSDDRDLPEKPGSYLACHSEKQLLAHFLWNHTTAFGRASLSASSNLLRETAPPKMIKLHPKIYICQPGQGKANMCSDCMDFCCKVVQRYGFRLTLRGIRQGKVEDIVEFG
jgi:hypothetical protein